MLIPELVRYTISNKRFDLVIERHPPMSTSETQSKRGRTGRMIRQTKNRERKKEKERESRISRNRVPRVPFSEKPRVRFAVAIRV